MSFTPIRGFDNCVKDGKRSPQKRLHGSRPVRETQQQEKREKRKKKKKNEQQMTERIIYERKCTRPGFVNNSEMIITHDDNSEGKKVTTRRKLSASKGLLFCSIPSLNRLPLS